MVAAALSEELEGLGIGECRGSEAFAREGEKDGGSESMSGMSRRRSRIKMYFLGDARAVCTGERIFNEKH